MRQIPGNQRQEHKATQYSGRPEERFSIRNLSAQGRRLHAPGLPTAFISRRNSYLPAANPFTTLQLRGVLELGFKVQLQLEILEVEEQILDSLISLFSVFAQRLADNAL